MGQLLIFCRKLTTRRFKILILFICFMKKVEGTFCNDLIFISDIFIEMGQQSLPSSLGHDFIIIDICYSRWKCVTYSISIKNNLICALLYIKNIRLYTYIPLLHYCSSSYYNK